ncbi:MAG: hypothetical protein EZS28_020731 [Streblomastix strix]|uniref:Uncharacterized protein n=1 Tax=Streblomastix strix TaxID=222440 RepID=A0A5J4VNA4_9EUKA|nr:MAG: hypothetical protein EZS28_020731 [Streblomastix strix]
MIDLGLTGKHLFFDILTNFLTMRRTQTTNANEVNIPFQIQDSVVNFKCNQIIGGTGQGNLARNEFVKIPGDGKAQRLGLTGRQYLEKKKHANKHSKGALSL